MTTDEINLDPGPMPAQGPAPSSRAQAVRDFIEARRVEGVRTQRAIAGLLGVSESQLSKALSEGVTTGRLEPIEAGITRYELARLSGQAQSPPERAPPLSGRDPLRPGYQTEEEWDAKRAAAASPEPLAPPGVVLLLVFEDADGEPIYGLDHAGRAVQLGRALRARTRLSSASVAASS